MALLRKVVEELPTRPSRRVPGIPRDIELICLKCLEKDPAERYASAEALAEDLGHFAAGEPVSVRAAGVVERAAKWARREPTLAAAYIFGLLTIILGGLGGLALWQWRAAEGARGVAVVARGEAERQRENFERSEYGRTVEVAQQEWRDHNVPASLALLDGTRKDLRGWEWRYVHRLCHSEQLTYNGHGNPLFSASFSPDGSRIISTGGDETVRIWDASPINREYPPPKQAAR